MGTRRRLDTKPQSAVRVGGPNRTRLLHPRTSIPHRRRSPRRRARLPTPSCVATTTDGHHPRVGQAQLRQRAKTLRARTSLRPAQASPVAHICRTGRSGAAVAPIRSGGPGQAVSEDVAVPNDGVPEPGVSVAVAAAGHAAPSFWRAPERQRWLTARLAAWASLPMRRFGRLLNGAASTGSRPRRIATRNEGCSSSAVHYRRNGLQRWRSHWCRSPVDCWGRRTTAFLARLSGAVRVGRRRSGATADEPTGTGDDQGDNTSAHISPPFDVREGSQPHGRVDSSRARPESSTSHRRMPLRSKLRADWLH